MVTDALARGRLEQACVVCGLWEAAGSYCSECLTPTGPDDWYANGDKVRRTAAARIAAADSPRGHNSLKPYWRRVSTQGRSRQPTRGATDLEQ